MKGLKGRIDIGKFRDIRFERRAHCLVCGEKSGPPIIDLPEFPMTEIYTNELIKEKVGVLDQNFSLMLEMRARANCQCDRCRIDDVTAVMIRPSKGE